MDTSGSSKQQTSTTLYFVKVMLLVTLFCVMWQMLVDRIESHWVQAQVAVAEREQYRAKYAALLQRDLDAMRFIAYEYGIWDETYAFALSRDPDYVDEHVLPTGANPADIAFYVFWDIHGKTLASARLTDDQPLPAELMAALWPLVTERINQMPTEPSSLIVYLAGELYLLGLTPILRNDASGPSRGSVVFARAVSSSLGDYYATLMGGRVSLDGGSFAGTAAVELGEPDAAHPNSFAAWRASGEALGHLHIERQSSLSSELREFGGKLHGLNALGTALLVSIGVLIVRRRIIRPLVDLQDQLQQRMHSDNRTPVRVSGALSEIRLVADDFNELIQQLQRNMSARSEADAALAASKLKSMFLATMSHEIRTPLAGLTGSLELASTASTDAERDRFLYMAKTANEHLMQLLDDVLDLSRIEADQLVLHRSYVRLDTLAHEAISLMRPRAEAKGLLIVADLGTPLAANSDPVRIRQILVNLLSNAVKFSDRGTIEVALRRAGESAEVIVSDRGCGVPEEKLELIFDAFRQLRTEISQRQSGTGLGLAISRRLARALGGDLTASQREGGGTVFKLLVRGVSDEPTGIAAGQLGAPDLAVLRGRQILIVDDDESIRLLVVSALSRLGAVVTEACDGVQALEKANLQPFDVILLDRHMATLDGLETARRLRRQPTPNQHTPIFAMTASTQLEDQEACIEAGMSRFVGKPIQLGELARLIAQTLG